MRLVCIEGTDKGLFWELTGDSTVIGRNSICNVVLKDPKVSRIRAEVIREGEGFILYDRNARNGSYINDNRVTSRRLIPGDTIKLGNTIIKVIEEELVKKPGRQGINPSITNKIPLDRLTTQVREFVSVTGKGGGKSIIYREEGISMRQNLLRTWRRFIKLEMSSSRFKVWMRC